MSGNQKDSMIDTLFKVFLYSVGTFVAVSASGALLMFLAKTWVERGMK